MEELPEGISGDPQGWLLGLLGSLTVVLAVFFTMIMMWTLRTSSVQWWRPNPGQSLGSELLKVRGLFTQLAALGTGLMLLAEILGLRARLLNPLQNLHFGRGIALRNIALVLMGGALVMLPAWNLLGAIPLGAIIGTELAVRRPRPQSVLLPDYAPNSAVTRTRRCLQVLAPIAFLLALAVARVDTPGSQSNWLSVVLIEVALMAACVVITAVLIRIGLGRLAARLAAELMGLVAGLRQSELRHRAQWVHDHLLSEIRLLILRLESRPPLADGVLEQLRETDHRLRMAHLDELIEAGPIRISSLIQPQIRRCLDHGITLTAVPHFGEVDAAVGADTGRLISRVLSGLFSNAMNAGAQRIGLHVLVDSVGVEIRVTDDAGGFDLRDVPVGRGLNHLIADLGSHSVTREESPGGSIMKVAIPHRLLVAGVVDSSVSTSGWGNKWLCR